MASSPKDSGVRSLSVAVLPLADHSDASVLAGRDAAHWCAALADELITALSIGSESIDPPPLRVVSRSASWPFGHSPDLAELRANLGVALALEGSVRRSDTRVRVTLRLVDTSDGHTVRAERIDHVAADPFDVHHQIATLVAARVRDTLH